MDYYVSNRQDDFEDTRALLVVGQIYQNINDQPVGVNPFQPQFRQQLVKQLRKTNLPGAATCHSWVDAVRIAQEQKEALAANSSESAPFSFESKALDMSEVIAYFERPEYTGQPMTNCLAAGANGRTYILQNRLHTGAPDDNTDKYMPNTTTENVKSVPVGNISLVSPQQELTCLSFFDEKRTVVDWSTTIRSLKRFALNSEYSAEMCKSALLTMIRMYRPVDQEILAEKSANGIARYLLQATCSVDRKLYHLDRLEKQTRKIGEPLQEAIAKVKLLAEQIYPEASGHRDRIVIRALMSFVDQPSSKMLSRSLTLAQQRGVEPNVDKLTEEVVRYELQTGKYPTQTMSMSRNAGLLPTFMSVQTESPDDNCRENMSSSFMSSKGQILSNEEEEERKRYLWHLNPAAFAKKDATRRRGVDLQQSFQENQAFFTLPGGKPQLYFPNPKRDGYLKLDAYTLPNPEMFAQAVEFSKVGPPAETDPFLKQLQKLKSAKTVTSAALKKAKENRQTLADAVVQLATKKLEQRQGRYPSRTRRKSSYNASKSAPTSRDNSPVSQKGAASATSTPGSSRASSRSRGSVKDGVYSRNGSQSRSPSLDKSADKSRSRPPRLPPKPGTSNKSNKQRIIPSRSRERSSSIQRFKDIAKLYPDMRLGVNCRPNYVPEKGESCSKCMTSKYDDSKHFEFRCPKYVRYNKDPCQKCFMGMHFDEVCSEVKTHPPPNLMENNPVPQDTERLQELQRKLHALIMQEEKND